MTDSQRSEIERDDSGSRFPALAGFYVAVCPCGWHCHWDEWTLEREAEADQHQATHAPPGLPRAQIPARPKSHLRVWSVMLFAFWVGGLAWLAYRVGRMVFV